MASPFQNDPNVQDIPPARAQGGFTPVDNDAVIKQASEAVQKVGGVVADEFQKGIEEDIKTQAQSLELALTARAFPKFAKQLLAEHAKDDPIVKGAMQEMSDIKLAMEQGVLPHQFALQRLSAIKEQAIGSAPEFSDEISAAVADVSGRDPDRALFSELLAPVKPTLSPEQKGLQKAEEEIAKQMALTGLDRDTIIEINQTRSLAQQEEASLKFLTTKGERLALNLNKRAVLSVGVLTEDVILELNNIAQTQGGVVDTADFARNVNSRFDAKIQELISDLPPGADLSTADGAIAQIEKQRDRLLDMVNDGSMLNLVNNNRDLLINGTKLGMIQGSPEVLTAFALNPNDATRGLDLITKMGKSEFGRQLAGELSTTARLINETEDGRQKFFNFYSNIITKGDVAAPVPTSPEDRNLHATATSIALRSQDPTVQSKALEQMLEVHGEEFAWASLGSREVFVNFDAQTMGKAAENLQISQTAALTNEFRTLSQKPGFDLSKFSINGNKLNYERSVSFARGDDPSQDLDIVAWVDKFNRAANISKKYVEGGKMNGSLYTGIDNYWDGITSESVQLLDEQNQNLGQPKQGRVKWALDENGIPTPETK